MARVGYRFPKVPAEDRFWQRVVPATTGCWTWTGARSTRGYGQFNPTADGHEPGDAGTPEWEENIRKEAEAMNAQLRLTPSRPAEERKP